MSLLHALDPGASPSRPGCEARGCRSTSTTSVRAYLGRPHPTTLRVCERHRRDLEIAGDLENPVICLIPECGRTRAALSRLCVEHDRIVVSAKINIPRKGVISAETLVAIRKAVEAEEKRQAAIAAAPPVRPQMEEPASFAKGQQAAAELIMEALNGRLAEMPAGVELSLQLALTGVVGLLASERGAVAQRDALAATVAAITATLDELRAPDGAQQPDGTIDTSEATRIRLLLAYWSDAIRSVLPGNAERATGERVEPLASLLRDIRAGLDAAQKDAQPAPPARPTQDERAPDYMGACWRHLADLVPGGTRIDVAVGEVTGKLRQARELLAEREKDYHAIVAIAERRGDEVRAASGALIALGVPMLQSDAAEPSYDLVERIGRLAKRSAVQADPLRVQATPMDARLFAAELALDDVGAPHHDDIVERIKGLAVRVDRLKRQEAELLKGVDSIAEALNVGPPNEFDIQAGTHGTGIVAQIVRSRSQALQEERARRVALAEELEALKTAAPTDPLAPAVDALVAWLSGPGGEQAHKGFKTGLLYALYRRAIEPMAAAEALGGLRALARLILSTPEPFDLPF